MRFYTVEHEISNLNPSAGDGLLIIEAPNNKVIQFVRAAFYDVERTTDDLIHIGVFPIASKGSLTGAGSPPTPRKHDPGDPASTVTVYECNSSGMATEPTTWGDPFDEQGGSNRPGYEYEPPFDAREYISPTGLFGVRMMNVPAAPFKAKILITFAEIGG